MAEQPSNGDGVDEKTVSVDCSGGAESENGEGQQDDAATPHAENSHDDGLSAQPSTNWSEEICWELISDHDLHDGLSQMHCYVYGETDRQIVDAILKKNRAPAQVWIPELHAMDQPQPGTDDTHLRSLIRDHHNTLKLGSHKISIKECEDLQMKYNIGLAMQPVKSPFAVLRNAHPRTPQGSPTKKYGLSSPVSVVVDARGMSRSIRTSSSPSSLRKPSQKPSTEKPGSKIIRVTTSWM
eukprot:2537933-Rhodomonas_salina.1